MKRSPCTAVISNRTNDGATGLSRYLKCLSEKLCSFSDGVETGIEELSQKRHDDELAVRVIRDFKNFVHRHAAIRGIAGARLGREISSNVDLVWVFGGFDFLERDYRVIGNAGRVQNRTALQGMRGLRKKGHALPNMIAHHYGSPVFV